MVYNMYPRVNYEMTEKDLEAIMEACKPVPMIMLQCGSPRSQQENANDAWAALGKKMGFDHMTVEPVSGKGNRFFTAVPAETEFQRAERVGKEKEQKRLEDIKVLEAEIAERRLKLDKLYTL